MGLEPQSRERQIRRVHFGTHIKVFAVVGFAHKAKEIDHLKQSALFDRATCDFAEPKPGDLLYPLRQGCTILRQRLKCSGRNIGLQPSIPDRDLIGQPADISARLDVIGMCNQPFDAEGHAFLFGREGHMHRGFVCLDGRNACVVRNVAQCNQTLTIPRRARFIVLRIVAQPDCMKPQLCLSVER